MSADGWPICAKTVPWYSVTSLWLTCNVVLCRVTSPIYRTRSYKQGFCQLEVMLNFWHLLWWLWHSPDVPLSCFVLLSVCCLCSSTSFFLLLFLLLPQQKFWFSSLYPASCLSLHTRSVFPLPEYIWHFLFLLLTTTNSTTTPTILPEPQLPQQHQRRTTNTTNLMATTTTTGIKEMRAGFWEDGARDTLVLSTYFFL